MSTNRESFANQSFNNLFGVVIGLYGDPANQDITNKGYLISDPNGPFWCIGGNALSDVAKVCFWSRVLVVEILVPNDQNFYGSRLALVSKPRSMWLYDRGDGTVSDFMGNTTSAATIGSSTDTTIHEPKPPYQYGDVIRLETLPNPISLAGWGDGYYRNADSNVETFDGVITRSSTLSANGITITGYSSYLDLTPDSIVYCDKNVDARSRFGGSPDNSGTVDIAICVGGVTKVYTMKGQLKVT